MIIVVIVVALVAALLIADRVTLIYAEDRLARRIGDWGFPAKPHVSIAGFPFLTQVAARHLNKVVVSAVGKKLGPVEVKRLDVILYGIRVSSSYHASTAAQLCDTALVGFASLAEMAGLPGLTAADGPDRVTITAGPRRYRDCHRTGDRSRSRWHPPYGDRRQRHLSGGARLAA